MSKSKKKLNDRQELFCLEFIKDLNATQAAIRAGYSERAAQQSSSRLMLNDVVKARISDLQKNRKEELNIDSKYVLQRLYEIDQMDVLDILNDDGTIKSIRDWPRVWRISLSGIDVAEFMSEDNGAGALKKIKWPDKIKNLELLGKHIDIGAFDKAQPGSFEFVMTGKKRDDEDEYL